MPRFNCTIMLVGRLIQKCMNGRLFSCVFFHRQQHHQHLLHNRHVQTKAIHTLDKFVRLTPPANRMTILLLSRRLYSSESGQKSVWLKWLLGNRRRLTKDDVLAVLTWIFIAGGAFVLISTTTVASLGLLLANSLQFQGKHMVWLYEIFL